MPNKILTSVELGYAPDERLLVINIDDVGFCLTANQSAITTLETGTACSCSVMMPPAWSIHACTQLREKKALKHGVHLTAISEHEMFRWVPITSPDKIASLIDGDGFFPLENEIGHLLVVATIHDLEIEWRAQIETAFARGLKPTHLDSHCNIHDAREDIFEMTFRLAREYGLAMRVHKSEFVTKLKQLGMPVIDHPDVDSYDLPTYKKSERYSRMMRDLPAGISEWAVHCARGTEEVRTINPRWRVRAADYKFFNSDECRQLIQSEGIRLVSYDLLQPYWKK
jgi:chitin disaccharide deacetylase